ncbi:ABC transporter substrate-binding protein [Agromyces sp. C10]|uniref:ABC transporter substrate-binding protein n=1 Tax=Agromyces sp. C10 TaxID=2935077 RepID=UPI00200B6A60|nr:ABC transporter substrate-binding protein [Agromyces sp. C10]MCK8610091.1 ABC transporter substrate-binding protein [Agromyces sp. C10]
MEFLTDHRGHVKVLHGEAPSAELVGFARAFLVMNRQELSFIYRCDGTWMSVRLERDGARIRGTEHATATTWPAILPEGITRREIEILTLLAGGMTSSEIAGRLGTSPRTVSTQVDRLMKKFDLHSRAGLAAVAVDAQLLALPVPGGVEGLNAVSAIALERMARALDAKTTRSAIDMPPPALHSAIGAKPQALPRRPILLGTIAALSGYAVEDGIEHVRGGGLAIEEINGNGGVLGRRIEHVVAGADLGDTDSVRQAMEELISAGVDAITASHVSAENPFLFDMVADYGKPFLHLDTFEAHAQLVRDHAARYGMVYQTCPSEKYYAMAFRRFLIELESAAAAPLTTRGIAIVEMDVPSAHIATAQFEASLGEVGWNVAYHQEVPAVSVDWSAVVRGIVASRADIVLVAHFVPSEVSELQRTLVQAGFPGLSYYVYTASHPTFAATLGPLAEGAIWSSVTTLTESDSASRFRRNYLLRYGVEPGPAQASAAYDQAQLLAWSWLRNGSTEPEGTARALRDALYRGLNGTYYFGSGDQTPLSYPDGTTDPTLGLPLITSQIQDGLSVALSPAPYGSIGRLRAPQMGSASPSLDRVRFR